MNNFFDPFSRFADLDTKLLISCPHLKEQHGGLFVVDFAMKNISKLVSADCRGIARDDRYYYVATNSHGIFKFDHEMNKVGVYNSSKLDYHGMAIGPDGLIYIVETARNTIAIHESTSFRKVDEIVINKIQDKDINHINDLSIVGNRLYLSMFSIDSNWGESRDYTRGIIAEYNLITNDFVKTHVENLHMPHSVKIIEDELYYCNSLGLSLNKGNNRIASLGGFTRGLAHDTWNYYVGQSEMRHLSRALKHVPNFSVDCGIHIIEKTTKSSRFLHLPASEVYDIVILSEGERNFPDSFDPSNESLMKLFISLSDWNFGEDTHVWTAAKQATVQLHKYRGRDKLILDLRNGYPGELDCDILVNSRLIGTAKFTEPEDQQLQFSLDSVHPGPIAITLSVSRLWSPVDVSESDDNRILGIAVKSIQIK
ncbi:DUF4915 domain-containing protein [Cohnella abietis]|uniref:Conserved hypothetical protein CHP03032 domain-containing protein n=1 Tax=Cohnella abietis TaxID=2507935 RepID=A0A3T1DC11_9BACL|nr:DUF4915 domain-containing protein [Cohnella abietis]BBI35676.1 hypothetical protein KCTCHS21_50750 [Cohnella abietis]